MTDTSRIVPPVAPANDEMVLPTDPSFELECKSALFDVPEKFKWRFKGSIQTTSKEWGLIWRMDFESPEHVGRAGFVNRVTCWREPEKSGGDLGISIAYGLRVNPLAGQ
jgi:hypothetical protein